MDDALSSPAATSHSRHTHRGGARGDTLTQQEREPAKELPYSEDPLPPGLAQEESEPVPPEFANEPPKRSKRRQTAHLKLVPQDRKLRDELLARAVEIAKTLDKSRPLTKDEMEKLVRQTLAEAGQPEGYVGWLMVVLASEFWQDQVAAVPPSPPAVPVAALPEARRRLPGRLRRVRPRLQKVRRVQHRRLPRPGRGAGLQGAGRRRLADRPQDHRQRPRRRDRRRRLPERAREGDRQDPARPAFPAWRCRCCRATAATRSSTTTG